MHRTRKLAMSACLSLGLVVACAGVMATGASATRVPQLQKITVKLGDDCADGDMDEGAGDADCSLSLSISPKSPTRSYSFQEAAPGAKKWVTIKQLKVSSGKASFDVTILDNDDAFRDGTYSFRVTAPGVKGKEKAFVSPTLKVEFIPAEADGDISDDFTDDAPATGGSGKTTQTTAKPSTATTPTTPDHSGTATATTVAATTTTVASGTNGGTPTMTTTTVSADNFYVPVRTNDEITSSTNCANNFGPVPTSVCDAVKTRKSKSELTTVLAGISSIYVRDNFCRWMFGFMDKGVSFTDAGNLCAQVNAKA